MIDVGYVMIDGDRVCLSITSSFENVQNNGRAGVLLKRSYLLAKSYLEVSNQMFDVVDMKAEFRFSELKKPEVIRNCFEGKGERIPFVTHLLLVVSGVER